MIANQRLSIFATCPQSADVDRHRYVQRVVDVARWSERYGCSGILVYTDNRLVDPWLVAQIIVQNTVTLSPLVAVQPIYMHPYTVAKMVSTFGHLYGRRLFLNMVAGGFKNDLEALGDTTEHDKRYDRLVEFTAIVTSLLKDDGAVAFDGAFYAINKLKLSPPLPDGLMPGILLSGSSEAGMAAAGALDAVAIQYPKPADAYLGSANGNGGSRGIRVGIIARKDEDDAWRVAEARFPEDRKGQIAHQLAMKVSDSVWHRQLSELGSAGSRSPYWLVPFKNYKTFCPYLVGSYERVSCELAKYVAAGYDTFILDIPPTEEELHHTSLAFGGVMEGVPA